ncbi:hypothetical protein Nepgr_028938 [Nepenthes gracilis]|uniref:Uncharacterized protein n=1 Tax=Nepenthes gracilis TaxID=150966 RepID=A0AAD3TBG2_NEPGR|nr:hypothetical protein Nepgr_028938 [Nepenthes gracilis]
MERLNFARVCVEVARGAYLPSKIRLNSSADVEASPVEIEVAYDRKPVHQNTDRRKQIRRGDNLTPLNAVQDFSLLSLNSGVGLGGLENQSDLGAHIGAKKELPKKSGSAAVLPLDQSVEYPSNC